MVINRKILLSALLGCCLLGTLWWIFKADSSQPAAAVMSKKSQPFLVEVETFLAQNQPRALTLTAETAPYQEVMLSAQVSGVVEKIFVTQGTWVKSGTLLVRLLPEHRIAARKAASAAVAKAKHRLEGAKKLLKIGSLTDAAFKGIQAEFEHARATHKAALSDVQKLEIKAPFDGHVVHYTIEVGSYVNPQAGKGGIGSFMQLNPLRVIGQVSQHERASVSVGQKARVRFVNGVEVEGVIDRVSLNADRQTRTYSVEVVVENEGLSIPASMSAHIILEQQAGMGHKLPTHLLSLNDQGGLGVYGVNAEDRVFFAPVDQVGSDADYFHVFGLPKEVRIITAGQYFVKPGEKVRVHTKAGHA